MEAITAFVIMAALWIIAGLLLDKFGPSDGPPRFRAPGT